MGLRHAEIVASMQKLKRRKYANLVRTVRLRTMSVIGEANEYEANIAPGVSVVTGGNGAGKTTMLRGLGSLMPDNRIDWPDRLESVVVEGESTAGPWRVHSSSSGGEVDTRTISGNLPNVVFIDPSEESLEVRRLLQKDPNARDLVEGIDPYELNGEWLDHASRILRRKYDSISVFEVEGVSGDRVIPWVRVAAGPIEYDLLNMGRGELSALYLIWRLNQVDKDSIVVIDEPELGLAAYSQARLMETLCYLSANQGIHFIITAHAPDMYLALEGEPVTILSALPSPSGNGPMPALQAAHALRAPARSMLAIFVEDVVAACMLRSLLRDLEPVLLDSIEIFSSEDGESSLSRVYSNFIEGDRKQRKLRLFTVLDGDQRPKNPETGAFADGAYLPGWEAPEAVLESTISNVLTFEPKLDLQPFVGDRFSFISALEKAHGSDHHDWFVEVAEAFSGYAATCDSLVRICLRDSSFYADSETLVKSIREKLNF